MAIRELNLQEYALLVMRYEEGRTLIDIANYFGLSESRISRKINIAIKKISKDLGGESPWV
jgi:RNA polymerase sigma factor (sigma-70 family)